MARASPAPTATRTASAAAPSTSHAGGEVGASNEWRAGLSYLALRPNDRQYTQTDLAGNSAQLSFSGKSQLAIADFVWKWAPNGNAMNTNFKLQGEYFWRKESGDLTYDSDGALRTDQSTSNYSSRQSGWYLDGVYQFMPYWRVGARYDRLVHGHRRLRGQRRLPRAGVVQSAAVLGDVRLHALGVQPLPRAVAAEQDPAATSPTTSCSSNTS